MIRLKQTIDESVLEEYGFVKFLIRNSVRYEYNFSRFSDCLQSVYVYITPCLSDWGEVVYSARQVLVLQDCGCFDKAFNLVAKLIQLGVFEYVDDEVI